MKVCHSARYQIGFLLVAVTVAPVAFGREVCDGSGPCSIRAMGGAC
jgi:hypothetical protein